MFARIALTFTLASSFFLTTHAGKEFKQRPKTKIVTACAIAAGLAALAKGYFGRRGSTLVDSENTFALGIGMLTGLGCAVVEHYSQKALPHGNALLPLIAYCSWNGERVVRQQVFYDTATPEAGNWNIARKASWASYLVYYGARYADDD